MAVPLRMEYRKPSGNGNVELQWSLIGDANASLRNATAAAAAADATIVVVGGSDQTTNEGCDRAELDLPGNQLGLVQAVHAASKRLVVVMTGGRPIAEPWIKENVGSVIASMCGGQAQGTALAAVIAGSYNPSGKLPVSFPRSAATLPVYCAPPCPTTPLPACSVTHLLDLYKLLPLFSRSCGVTCDSHLCTQCLQIRTRTAAERTATTGTRSSRSTWSPAARSPSPRAAWTPSGSSDTATPNDRLSDSRLSTLLVARSDTEGDLRSGASYTQFNFSHLSISSPTALTQASHAGESELRCGTDATVHVSFDVANVGEVAGTEVAQVYIGDDISSVVTP